MPSMSTLVATFVTSFSEPRPPVDAYPLGKAHVPSQLSTFNVRPFPFCQHGIFRPALAIAAASYISRGIAKRRESSRCTLQCATVKAIPNKVACDTASDDFDIEPVTECNRGTATRRSALTPDDIVSFTSVGDMDGLHAALKGAYEDSVRVCIDGGVPIPESSITRGAGLDRTTVHKLEHDIEQFQYLADRRPDMACWINGEVLPAFRKMLEHASTGDVGSFYWFDFAPAAVAQNLLPFYNRGLHVPESAPVSELLNGFDGDVVNQDYFHNDPHVAVVDDVLSPDGLEAIRNLLLETTVWHEAKAARRIGGYVGAYLTDGLHSRALLALSAELTKRLPHIFADRPLRFLWAYKYDHRYSGVNVHADDAAVNVNLWLTPDTANLDPETGGLVVYNAAPPPEWSPEEYKAAEQSGFKDLLARDGCKAVRVPYKMNRMVIFDSTLLHQTDAFDFKAGYENRRINLTLLFGERP